jgi:phage gp16-like protein
MINDQQRKLIHLAKRKINLADADYRAMLQHVAGVESSNNLDDASFSAVMAELGRLGFHTVQQAPQFGERSGWATEAQLNYIRSLWRKYAGTEDEVGMRHFLQKHFNVSSLRFLDSATVPKVIVTFKRMAEQRKACPGKNSKPSAA